MLDLILHTSNFSISIILITRVTYTEIHIWKFFRRFWCFYLHKHPLFLCIQYCYLFNEILTSFPNYPIKRHLNFSDEHILITAIKWHRFISCCTEKQNFIKIWHFIKKKSFKTNHLMQTNRHTETGKLTKKQTEPQNEIQQKLNVWILKHANKNIVEIHPKH